MKKFFSTHTLVTTAMLIALSVVLRLLGFPQTGTVRFEFGFLPIAVIGQMFGAIMGGVSYIIADIIGTFLTGTAPFWTITICKFLLGALFGIFFHKRKMSFLNISLCVVTIGILIDLIAMPFALLPLYPGKGLFVIMYQRLLMSAINIPTRIISIVLVYKYLGTYIEKHLNKRG